MQLPPDPACPAAPAALLVLDPGEAIGRMLGDRALYARLLVRFGADHGDAAGRIRGALAGGEHGLAQRLAHTLHGAAGTIGAHRLQRLARELEPMLRTEKAEGPCLPGPELAQLEDALGEVLGAIGLLLAADREPGAAVAIPAARLTAHTARSPSHDEQALLARLRDLLGNGDGAALDLIDASGACLAASLGQARLEEVAAAAREFDFEAALALLPNGPGPIAQ